jgi:hypothetical protein
MRAKAVVVTFDRARLAGALDADVAPYPAGRPRSPRPLRRTGSPGTLVR